MAPDEFNTFRFIIDGTGATFAPGQSYSYQVGQIDFNLLGILLGDVTIGAGAGEQAQFSTVGLANASDFSWTLTDRGGCVPELHRVVPFPSRRRCWPSRPGRWGWANWFAGASVGRPDLAAPDSRHANRHEGLRPMNLPESEVG